MFWFVQLILSDLFCVFKQKTAYELRISDWSSDVCSSDLDFMIWSAKGLLTRDHHQGSASVPDQIMKSGNSPSASPASFRCMARRSEERRVGKECVRTCRSGWSPYH